MAEQSKLEDRLRLVTSTQKDGDKKGKESEISGKSKLDQALEEEDSDLATELKRSRAEEKLTQRQVNINKLKKEMNKSDDGETGEKVGEKPKRWTIVDGKPVEDPDGEYRTLAQALLVANANVRWTVIDGRPIEDPEGEYRTFAQALRVAALDRLGQDTKRWTVLDDKPIEDPKGEFDSFADAYKAAYLSILKKQKVIETPKQENPEQLKVLVARMDSLDKQLALALNPIETLKRANAIREELTSAGFISPSSPGNSLEDNLAIEKEKNRHAEEMRKLDTEENFKKSISNTFADMPKNFGKGVSEKIMKNIGASPANDGMEHINCEKCGAPIVVPPGTVAFKCPKCNVLLAKGVVPEAGGPEASEKGEGVN